MRTGKRKLASEINVVPYIDVMLVLLIIFMITAPLLTPGIEVDLPEASTEPISQPQDPVTLYIDAAGKYFLDIGEKKSEPLSADEVVRRVGAVLRNRPDAMILVKGDKQARYERVAQGMALLQEAGAQKVGFVTEASAPRRTAPPPQQEE